MQNTKRVFCQAHLALIWLNAKSAFSVDSQLKCPVNSKITIIEISIVFTLKRCYAIFITHQTFPSKGPEPTWQKNQISFF